MKRTPLRPKVRKMTVLRCESCSTLFKRRADSKTRTADGAVLCNQCSRARRVPRYEYPERRTGRAVTCNQCGVEFYRSPSRIGANEQFCSRACRTEWQKVNPLPRGFVANGDNRGEKNGRYTHGRRVGTNTNKADVRRAVIRRDGDWCLVCGKPPPGLHLHRVVYGSQGGRYEDGNCVQLCGADHELVHSNKRVWQPRLLGYLGGGSFTLP